MARQAADSSTQIDEQSTRILGTLPLPREAAPFLPKQTSSRSLPVDTMVKRMSTPARSAGASTMRPPCLASGSAFDRVRFQTLTVLPAFSSRSAIG